MENVFRLSPCDAFPFFDSWGAHNKSNKNLLNSFECNVFYFKIRLLVAGGEAVDSGWGSALCVLFTTSFAWRQIDLFDAGAALK